MSVSDWKELSFLQWYQASSSNLVDPLQIVCVSVIISMFSGCQLVCMNTAKESYDHKYARVFVNIGTNDRLLGCCVQTGLLCFCYQQVCALYCVSFCSAYCFTLASPCFTRVLLWSPSVLLSIIPPDRPPTVGRKWSEGPLTFLHKIFKVIIQNGWHFILLGVCLICWWVLWVRGSEYSVEYAEEYIVSNTAFREDVGNNWCNPIRTSFSCLGYFQ